MRVFLFSFWFLPDNRTAVNRIKYFKKKFVEAEVDLHLIFCDDGIDKTHQNNLYYKIPYVHFFYRFSRFLLKKQWLTLYKIVHFFYLVSRKRDVYDFYRNYKAIESTRAIRFDKNDIVITSAPPYSALNIGYYLKKKFGVKWIIDYRDPWTLGYSTLGYSNFADKLRKLIQRKDELRFLEAADHIITVSESLEKYFPVRFQHKIHVIPNGANTDEMDFNKINGNPQTFSIVYAGTMHPQQLEETYFFNTVKKFLVNEKIEPENFKIHFIGSAESEELKNEIEHYKLNDFINITSRVDFPVLYEYMYNASMFLHLRYANRNKIITSKQFDYLVLQKPILLPQSDSGDIAESILKNKAGYVCNNSDELYFILKQEYSKFIEKQDVRIKRDQQFINQLSRNAASNKLLELLYANADLNKDLQKELEHISYD
jgi:Glycosyltransferase Family 4